MHASVIDTLAELGCEVVSFAFDARACRKIWTSVVAAVPLGTLVAPRTTVVVYCRPGVRRSPCGSLSHCPTPLCRSGSDTAPASPDLGMERLAFRQNAGGRGNSDRRLQWITRIGWRLRSYGELHWLHRAGVHVGVGGQFALERRSCLRARGFDPIVAYARIPAGLGRRPGARARCAGAMAWLCWIRAPAEATAIGSG